jgi:DNA-binding CsgD family transcriptional regulator
MGKSNGDGAAQFALLEREHELTELDALVRATRAGRGGRLVSIEAHAGLGKTRLLQAARAIAERAGLRVLSARGSELERAFPFALTRQLLEPSLAALPASDRNALLADAGPGARGALGMTDVAHPTGGGDTFTVLHGLYRVTAALAEREPLLLAIDDAHWADPASLDYLEFLLPRLEALPALVAVAARTGEPGVPPGLARIATDPLAHRLMPRALSAESAGTLLAAELGAQPDEPFTATCHELTGGNPFLLRELGRTVAREGLSPAASALTAVRELAPARIARTVQLRLSRLSPSARAIAHALVVLGDDVEPRTAAAFVQLSATEAQRGADELRAAAIADPGASLRFVHPLVRNAADAELPAGERAVEHARAAGLLRAHGASAELIGTHLLVSDPGDDSEACETLLLAGTRALASGAPRSAIAYLLRALREPPPRQRRAAVLQPLIAAGRNAADLDLYDAIEADVLDELERDPRLRVRWASTLAMWMIVNRRYADIGPLMRQALAQAEQEGDPEQTFRLQALITWMRQPPLDEARAHLEPYIAHLEPDSAGRRLAASLMTQWTLSSGTATAAIGFAREALAGGMIFDDPSNLGAWAQSLLALVFADQLDEAELIARGALERMRDRGATADIANVGSLYATVALRHGELSDAEARIREAIEVARLGALDDLNPILVAILIMVLIERGDLRTAQRELDAHDATAIVPHPYIRRMLNLQRGRLHLAQGRSRRAAEVLLAVHEDDKRLGIDGDPLSGTAVFAVRALLACGERSRARELAGTQVVEARRWGAPTTVSFAQRTLGLAVGGSEGLALMREAAAVLDDSPARLERAHALSELGAALRRAGHRRDAREPLREALALARRCGAAGLARDTDHELQACGERRRRHTPIGAGSLTPGERRVAELAASGMTNRQIAQALFLTVKTIEAHLSASYDKLGIGSRQQLAEALTAG